jgi:hypothetical protein
VDLAIHVLLSLSSIKEVMLFSQYP